MLKCIVVLLFLICSSLSYAACSLSNIKITLVKAKFESPCGDNKCKPILKGVATLENNCSDAIGVEIKITSYDKLGSPISTKELWPASVRNIPPGSYTFSLNQYIDHDPSISSLSIVPVDIKRW